MRTNRDVLNSVSNERFAGFLIRYTNCAVCVVRKECPHVIHDAPSKTGHKDDKTCGERIEEWLGREARTI